MQQYHRKIWASARCIHAQLVVWGNMREQIFHKNKIDARGSIRKAPNVISWTMSLNKLRRAGDKDAGAIIRAWNTEASKQQQIGMGQGSGAQTSAEPHVGRCLQQRNASGGERAQLGEMPLVR